MNKPHLHIHINRSQTTTQQQKENFVSFPTFQRPIVIIWTAESVQFFSSSSFSPKPTFNPLDSTFFWWYFVCNVSAISHSVCCVSMSSALCDKNYQFLCVDLNGQTMKMEIKGSRRKENERIEATTRYFWYYVACMFVSIHIHYTLCTRKPYFSFSLQVFSSHSLSLSLSLGFFFVVFNSTLLMYVCYHPLFTQWPSFFFLFFSLSHFISFSLIFS